jgi:CrcB protein
VQYVAVAVGAMLGANLRFVVGNWAADRFGADFPYGTFIINVSGAFAIGIILSFS